MYTAVMSDSFEHGTARKHNISDSEDADEQTIKKPVKKRRFFYEDEQTESIGTESVASGSESLTASVAGSIVAETKPSVKVEKYRIASPLPNTIKHSDDVSVSLPDPFPLPINYRPDVEECLRAGKMTKTSRSSFFSSVAGAMFNYKRFPSHDEKVRVARQIESKYPFLGVAGVGRSYVSFQFTTLLSLLHCTILCSLGCHSEVN